MYPGKRGEVVEPKGYIYYFGDIVFLLKYVQEDTGLKYLGYFKKIHLAQVNVMRNDSCKMISAGDPKILNNAGKLQFSTCKYKKKHGR